MTVIVGVFIAVLGGVVALLNVPVQLTPDIERPFVTVTTSWYGASPEEIEKEIVEKQEEYLKSVEGVVEMNSESTDGRGTITLEFAVGTEVEGALVRVTNRLNEVPSYPENADKPVIATSAGHEGAIAWFIVRSDEGVNVPQMKTLIDEVVKPRMERVEGVSAVNIYGGLEQELHVTFDPEILASSGITISELIGVLRSENRDISGGDFSEGKRRYIVRTVSRFESPEDVRQTVIKTSNNVPIYVGDVAEVSLDYRKPAAVVRNTGQPAIAFNAQRQIGANVLDVLDGLMAQLEIVNKEILEPRGMYAVNVYRETVYIDSAINLVLSNIILGGILAILVLFFFLRSPSSVLIIGMSIPISVITTFLTMYLFGRTINVISLAGMAFAVGMVVDNSIIVLENIYRHLQMGKSRWQAACDGASEVWGALVASTVTTVAVFLPIMFVQEQAGQLFRDIAIAISSAIVVSLVVAITVIPSLSARIMKTSVKLGTGANDQSRLGRFSSRISDLVDFINSRQQRRLTTILAMVVLSLGLSWLMLPGAEYLPNGNRNIVFAFMLPPPGYNIDEMITLGKSIESQIRPLWEAAEGEADTLAGGGLSNFFYVAFGGGAFLGLVAREDDRAAELVPLANEALASIPGAFGFANQASLFGGGFSGTRSIKIDITGPELPQILSIAQKVFSGMAQALPGSSSRPVPGLDLGNPEVRIVPDRTRAADVGMSATEIGQAVNCLVDGMKVGEYHHEGQKIDLILKGRSDWISHTQDIAQLPLATRSGRIITIGDLAEISLRQGPVQINHVERQRAVSVLTVLPGDIPLEEAMAVIENDIVAPLRQSGEVGGLYDIKTSGAADDLTKLRAALQSNFLIAIILTYLLLAALFQSFTYPLVIMLTVPLATFGGVMGLRLVQLFAPGQQLDILTMLGFVILVGTVINNSILIVHHALRLMKEGMDAQSAVKESVRVRVRPIFMSTSTSALGMLPLIVMPGAGSELYRGLGSVVVGGLVFSSVFTLVLTPLVFSYSIELVQKVRTMFGLKPVAVSSTPQIES